MCSSVADMYQEFGRLLSSARTRQALSQGELAAQLEVAQQTVSRWEKGQSRPPGKMVARVAAALDLDVGELVSAAGRTAKPDSDPGAEPLPTRPLLRTIPLTSLAEDVFEQFVAELVERRFQGATVSQIGGRGDDQRGFDILVVKPDGQRIGIQCKRTQSFGPAKARQAVKDAEIDVDESVIALARTATSAVRFEMENHSGWSLWDQADLSRQVRRLPDESAIQLVRAYFPSHVASFLGMPGAGPWMTVDEFYRRTPSTILDHRQELVGRDAVINEMLEWVADPESSNIAIVVGRGGLGKSKILRDVASRRHESEVHFRFVALDQTPAPTDFDSLPRAGGLVVVIDDAHGMGGIAGLAAQLRQHRPNAKLLLASRPDGKASLSAEVRRLNQSLRHVKSWILEDLSPLDARKLVSSLINRPVTDPLVCQLAAISADCPFVGVIAADLLERGELSGSAFGSDVLLREEVFRRFGELITDQGSGTEAIHRREVLVALAAFQPVRLSDEAFATAITSVTGLASWDEVNGRICQLEDAGLVLRRSGSVRVVPDMLADIVLSQAAYDDRADRATSYLRRAQHAARGAALQHLLVNASRMDWQVRSSASTCTDMVGELWTNLHHDVASGTYEQQVELLKLCARMAHYQPQRALSLVEAVLATKPRATDAPQVADSTLATSREDAVHAIAPVLRNIACHLEFLRSALDLLWSLAQGDKRPPNQHPDHPLRVLKELADFRSGKPLEYIEVVVDAASSWLAEPSKVSPFDVIEPVLAVEGCDHVSSHFALTFYPFAVSPDAVRDIRSRVIKLAVEQARSGDVSAAVRGIRALENSIRGPVGMFGRSPSDEEQAAWSKEFVPVIRALGRIGAEPEHDPAVRVAIREAVRWHAAYGPRNTKTAANLVLDSLATSLDDELAQCLHDGWGSGDLGTASSYAEAECERAARFGRVARAMSEGRDDDEVLQHLEERLHVERTALDGGGSSGRFLWEVFAARPTIAIRLCEAVLSGSYPELTGFVAPALSVLANAGDARAVALADAMADSPSVRLQRAAAGALSWNRGGRTKLLGGERELLTRLAEHADELVRASMGRAVYLIGLSDTTEALDLLARVEFGQSTKVAAESLSSLAPRGPLRWGDADSALRDSLLDQLLECKSIDEYELKAALSELSRLDPLRVTSFLLDRIEERTIRRDWDYEALPRGWDPPLGVRETAQLARCLAEVRARMTSSGSGRGQYSLRDDMAALYGLLAVEWDHQALSVLDVDSTSSPSALLAVARILGHAPSTVLFDNVSTVARLLHQARRLDRDEARAVFQALLPTNHGVHAAWLGHPGHEDARSRDRARQTAQGLPRGSIERGFFQTLADSTEDRLRLMTELPDRSYDMRDW